jgi:magnesium and cobalt transporter
MDLEQFCELMEIEVPEEEEEVNTVGGLVLSLFGALPKEGDVIRHDALEFQVEKVEGTRIHEIRVKRVPIEPEPSAEDVGGA